MKILSATSIMFPSLSSTRYDRMWIIPQLQTGYVVGKSSDLFIFDLPEGDTYPLSGNPKAIRMKPKLHIFSMDQLDALCLHSMNHFLTWEI